MGAGAARLVPRTALTARSGTFALLVSGPSRLAGSPPSPPSEAGEGRGEGHPVGRTVLVSHCFPMKIRMLARQGRLALPLDMLLGQTLARACPKKHPVGLTVPGEPTAFQMKMGMQARQGRLALPLDSSWDRLYLARACPKKHPVGLTVPGEPT